MIIAVIVLVFVVCCSIGVSYFFGPVSTHPPYFRSKPVSRENHSTFQCDANLSPEQLETFRREWYEMHKGSGNAATLRNYKLAKDAVARVTTNRKPVK